MGNWTQNQASAMAILLPSPKSVAWAEEVSAQERTEDSGSSGEIMLRGMVSDYFLCILQTY